MPNNEKSNQQFNINWYPGHMAKTKKQIIEDLKLIDVVIEILDARIPISSRNPDLESLIENKERIIILNKVDLADEYETKEWINLYKKKGVTAIAVNSNSGNGIAEVIKNIKNEYEKIKEKYIKKGRIGKTIKVMVIGIPNVGKSSFINKISKRNAQEVGNKPGVTKGQRWLRTSANIQVLDTPGILWPKFSDQEVGYKLAAFGAIKDSVFHADDVALYVLKNLREYYAKDLVKFSKLNEDDIANMSDPDFLLAMTEKYGMRDDYDRFSLFMLQRLRKGAIGRITLDRP